MLLHCVSLLFRGNSTNDREAAQQEVDGWACSFQNGGDFRVDFLVGEQVLADAAAGAGGDAYPAAFAAIIIRSYRSISHFKSPAMSVARL